MRLTAYEWLMLIVEILVLLLIGYEVGKGLWESRRNRKKRAEIYQFLGKGSALQGNPPSIHEQERVHEWARQVEVWISETRVYLGKECSPQASLVFLSDVSPSTQFLHRTVQIAQGAEPAYRLLLTRMTNLTRILEGHDTYY